MSRRSARAAWTLLLGLTLGGCPGNPETDTSIADSESASPETSGLPHFVDLAVQVTVDGVPEAGVGLVQGGQDTRWVTSADGRAVLRLNTRVDGDWVVVASHPEARTRGFVVEDPSESVLIELVRFDTSDNPDYAFDDPGAPNIEDSTLQCSHCHVNAIEDWYPSIHRASASNPVVQDVYAGAASGWASEADCVAAGGDWWSGLEPGTRESSSRCYVGHGALPDLKPMCGTTGACDTVATAFGLCADCHAPGLNGVLGGRDLLEATGNAYEDGVHCDVCHKVESVDLDAGAPGVAGVLRILRPAEPSPSAAMGDWWPLTFGPWDDVPNPRMGAVARDHFQDGTMCAGCHQLDQPVLIPGQSLDTARWPEGTLPIHTTWEEWQQGPFSPGVACPSCHMPPDPTAGNGAAIEELPEANIPGLGSGWWRPPGSMRRHTWYGPRHSEQRMIDLAASLDLDAEVATTASGEVLSVAVTVRNVGPGHALPTGEPLRHVILRVDARCGEEVLEPAGGDVVPDYGGALATRDSGEDWAVWPEASVGDWIHVIRRTGGYRDYTGTGPFGDGRFDAVGKGLEVEEAAGRAQVLAVDADGRVTLDRGLPTGDQAWLGSDDPSAWTVEGDVAGAWAGTPGFGFARVLADAGGQRMVPHHRAVDVVSDNRLLPQSEWTTAHTFAARCEAPVVRAALLYRGLPWALARERGWTLSDAVIAEASAVGSRP